MVKVFIEELEVINKTLALLTFNDFYSICGTFMGSVVVKILI